MIKKFNFKNNFEFFTYEEVCSFYEEYKKTLYKENENVDFIAFMINFKVIENFVKTNKILFLDENKINSFFLKNPHLKLIDLFAKIELNMNGVLMDSLYFSYNMLNISHIAQKKTVNLDTNSVIENLYIEVTSTSDHKKTFIKCQDIMSEENDYKLKVEKLFKNLKYKDYEITNCLKQSCDKDIFKIEEIFLNNLEEIKNLFKLTSIKKLGKLKEVQKIFEKMYLFHSKEYDFLISLENINYILPYVLNKDMSDRVDIFNKLNNENKNLFSIYMLEDDPSSEIYLNHLKYSVKENEDFYRSMTKSKKVTPLIDRYTNNQEVDWSKYIKYKNSVSFIFSKKDITDLMPHISKNLINNFFGSSFPYVEDKISATSYNGKYIVTYSTNNEISTKDFIQYFISNITDWISNGNSIGIIEEHLEKHFRSVNLLNSLEENTKNKIMTTTTKKKI